MATGIGGVRQAVFTLRVKGIDHNPGKVEMPFRPVGKINVHLLKGAPMQHALRTDSRHEKWLAVFILDQMTIAGADAQFRQPGDWRAGRVRERGGSGEALPHGRRREIHGPA